MQQFDFLCPGQYYHIYNRGINSCDLFKHPDNYKYFQTLLEKFVSPVAEIYSWVILPNHFHLLIRVKESISYKYSKIEFHTDLEWFNAHKWETKESNSEEATVDTKIPDATLHFSHIFNSYSKYYNTKYSRHGSLFERPFKRKKISSIKYFKNVVLYIHYNPVQHGFCSHPVEYPWSSYLSCLNDSSALHSGKVVGWFNSKAEYIQGHNENIEFNKIETWLGL
jgi:putative transposase